MDFPDSVRFLYAIGNELKTAKFDLDRMRALLRRLGQPENACRFVHVAGTNGKGSVCAMVESALRAAGVKTGLYTSPHLVSPLERIRIGGEPVTELEFTAAFDRVHTAAERMLNEGLLEFHPTYFETVTAMAFCIFAERGVETVVLETGLGGRLDATNVVKPGLTVITPVDLDHQEFLGNTIAAIAGEKAGIVKAGVPLVLARQHGEARDEILAKAFAVGAEVFSVADWTMDGLEFHEAGCRFIARSGVKELEIECPLAGEHQAGNALTAAVALDALGLPPMLIHAGIAEARWPARLERVPVEPLVVIDGAHNVAAAQALAAYVRRFLGEGRVTLIFGAMKDKDVEAMAGILFPLAGRIILTAARNSRALPPAEVAARAGQETATISADITEALSLARADANPILVAGSLFLAGEARQELGLQ